MAEVRLHGFSCAKARVMVVMLCEPTRLVVRNKQYWGRGMAGERRNAGFILISRHGTRSRWGLCALRTARRQGLRDFLPGGSRRRTSGHGAIASRTRILHDGRSLDAPSPSRRERTRSRTHALLAANDHKGRGPVATALPRQPGVPARIVAGVSWSQVSPPCSRIWTAGRAGGSALVTGGWMVTIPASARSGSSRSPAAAVMQSAICRGHATWSRPQVLRLLQSQHLTGLRDPR